jgi:hypothetical protein
MSEEKTPESVLQEVKQAVHDYIKATQGKAPLSLYVGSEEHAKLRQLKDFYSHWDFERKTFLGMTVFVVREFNHLRVI